MTELTFRVTIKLPDPDVDEFDVATYAYNALKNYGETVFNSPFHPLSMEITVDTGDIIVRDGLPTSGDI